MIRTGGVGVTPNDITGIPAGTRFAWATGLPNPGQPATGGLSNGTDTWGIAQRKHVIEVAGTLQLVYAWASHFEDNTVRAGLPSNPGTISTTVWKQSANPNTGGTPVDLLFDGATSVTINPAEIIVSDSSIPVLPGDVIWERTLVTVPDGGKWPLGTRVESNGEDGGKQGTGAAPDLIHGGAISTNTYPDTRFSACSSIAVGAAPWPAVVLHGTSIAEGSNAAAHESYVVQACNAASIPVVRLGVGGGNMSGLTQLIHHRMKYALSAQGTVIVNEHGVNDFSSKSDWIGLATLARTQHSQLAAIGGGRPVIQCTLPPSYAGYTKQGTEQDYIFEAGETPSASNAVRTGFNAWVRAGCPEIGGTPVAPGTAGAVLSPYLYRGSGGITDSYIEVADWVESVRDSGIWKGSIDGTTAGRYSADGTHPSQIGTAAIVPHVDTDVFWRASGLTKPAIPPPPVVEPPPAATGDILNLVKYNGSLVRLA